MELLSTAKAVPRQRRGRGRRVPLPDDVAQEAVLLDALKALDRDNTGCVSLGEMLSALEHLGYETVAGAEEEVGRSLIGALRARRTLVGAVRASGGVDNLVEAIKSKGVDGVGGDVQINYEELVKLIMTSRPLLPYAPPSPSLPSTHAPLPSSSLAGLLPSWRPSWCRPSPPSHLPPLLAFLR